MGSGSWVCRYRKNNYDYLQPYKPAHRFNNI